LWERNNGYVLLKKADWLYFQIGPFLHKILLNPITANQSAEDFEALPKYARFRALALI